MRYGCSRCNLSSLNFNTGLGWSSSGAGGGAGLDLPAVFDAAAFSSGWPAELFTSSSGMSNHSHALMAASWMDRFSIRQIKSSVLPPCLHSLKQFQMFFSVSTRNCVLLVPLWMGHGPLNEWPVRLKVSSN